MPCFKASPVGHERASDHCHYRDLVVRDFTVHINVVFRISRIRTIRIVGGRSLRLGLLNRLSENVSDRATTENAGHRHDTRELPDRESEQGATSG